MSILDNLNAPATADQTQPGPGATLQAPQDPSQDPLFLSLTSGKVPGVYVPVDTDLNTLPKIGPKEIVAMGLDSFKPHAQDIIGVIFNPKSISVADLQKLDQEGKLTQALPPVSQFLGAGSQGPVAGLQAPVDGQKIAEPGAGAAQPVSMPQKPTPVLPRPTFGADAQRIAAELRSQPAGGVEPSKRMMPGAGGVLNGLLQKPV